MTAQAALETKNRNLYGYLGLMLRGFAMGVCNVIPGISGGTMALLTGIYVELIESIRTITNPAHIKRLVRFQIKEILATIPWKFLTALLIGVILGVLSLAHFMEFLLVTYPIPVWSFFFGLIIASALIVSKRIRRWRIAHYTGLTLGTAAMYIVAGLVPMSTPDTLLTVFLSGMLAICAMVLPGISGAFILVLLGKYHFMVAALNNGDLPVVVVFTLGSGIGLVSFAQLLGWLFKRYHDQTVVVLIGLMLGSLRLIWPWKAAASSPDPAGWMPVNPDVANVLPDFSSPQVLLAVALVVVAFGIVVLFETLSGRRNPSHTAE
ncbi:MAG: DUF368 domain-containing protein [Anaerolineaceae bacterium]|nr:DUF368 domain-containing protein [Anaerolineaceae bacterium]